MLHYTIFLRFFSTVSVSWRFLFHCFQSKTQRKKKTIDLNIYLLLLLLCGLFQMCFLFVISKCVDNYATFLFCFVSIFINIYPVDLFNCHIFKIVKKKEIIDRKCVICLFISCPPNFMINPKIWIPNPQSLSPRLCIISSCFFCLFLFCSLLLLVLIMFLSSCLRVSSLFLYFFFT